MNCGNEMKMKKWSSQWTQFMQLHKEAWKKFRTSAGFEPVTSWLPVRCSTNWAVKPLPHNWRAPIDPIAPMGFIAQLVEHRTGNREVTGSNLFKTTPRNYGFLKRIISADDVVSDAFRWYTRQNEGVTGTYSVISWSANFYWWILGV